MRDIYEVSCFSVGQKFLASSMLIAKASIRTLCAFKLSLKVRVGWMKTLKCEMDRPREQCVQTL